MKILNTTYVHSNLWIQMCLSARFTNFEESLQYWTCLIITCLLTDSDSVMPNSPISPTHPLYISEIKRFWIILIKVPKYVLSHLFSQQCYEKSCESNLNFYCRLLKTQRSTKCWETSTRKNVSGVFFGMSTINKTSQLSYILISLFQLCPHVLNSKDAESASTVEWLLNELCKKLIIVRVS